MHHAVAVGCESNWGRITGRYIAIRVVQREIKAINKISISRVLDLVAKILIFFIVSQNIFLILSTKMLFTSLFVTQKEELDFISRGEIRYLVEQKKDLKRIQLLQVNISRVPDLVT